MDNNKNYIIIIFVIFLFTLMYTIFSPKYTDWKGIDKKDDKTFCQKFFNRLYYSLAVSSTVGHGDIVPISKKGKIISMLHMFIIATGLYIFLKKFSLNYFHKKN